MLRKIFIKSCVSVLAIGVVVSAMPAYAGFEWVPSDAGIAYPPAVSGGYAAAPQSPSVATNMPEVISPVVISGAPKPAPLEVVPVGRDRVDLATATIGSSPASAGGDVVRGFASQIPLVLALRQVLPAGYGFSLDQDVDMDVLVSYKGGKPWRETLGGMLDSVGLVSHEQGTSVAIGHVSVGVVTAPPRVVVKPMAEAPALVVSSVPVAVVPAFNNRSSFSVVPAMPSDVPVVDGGSGGWTVQRGDTLRKALTEWCQRSGVELQWLAEYDYPIEASAHFSGGFEDALRGLLAGFESARPQPVAELHANSSAGQSVLVVQARGNTNSN